MPAPRTGSRPAVLTRVTNATSKSLIQLAKPEVRLAYGFRNPASQRRTPPHPPPITHRNQHHKTTSNQPTASSRLTSKTH